ISSSAPAAGAADEIILKLERLATLRERGVLTDEEFAAQKARILAS
ncbi:SHOCT domain-containing protein, partial [Xylella fastidiosa subsp. multiplex]|nr:SHOCT domain-containing protein [Xylella fastidiosa subsp. multiplex]